jgi:hypothetical protein
LYRHVQGGTLLYMETITSAEFRKRYASLAEPMIVTVNGHPIGTWRPLDVAAGVISLDHEVTPAQAEEIRTALTPMPGDRFNTQPFMGPIPKKR